MMKNIEKNRLDSQEKSTKDTPQMPIKPIMKDPGGTIVG